MSDLIERQAAIDAVYYAHGTGMALKAVKALPSAQPEYEPVKAEDFAKTMSENTLHGFMSWYGGALALMKEQGFVICKKTM